MEETNQTAAGGGQEQGKKNVGMAIVAYILFFIPLLTDAKNDPFVKYHVKQGLVLFVLAVISAVISWMPVFFWISWLVNIFVLVLFIIGVVNAVNGKEKQLPLIGRFAEKFNI